MGPDEVLYHALKKIAIEESLKFGLTDFQHALESAADLSGVVDVIKKLQYNKQDVSEILDDLVKAVSHPAQTQTFIDRVCEQAGPFLSDMGPLLEAQTPAQFSRAIKAQMGEKGMQWQYHEKRGDLSNRSGHDPLIKASEVGLSSQSLADAVSKLIIDRDADFYKSRSEARQEAQDQAQRHLGKEDIIATFDLLQTTLLEEKLYHATKEDDKHADKRERRIGALNRALDKVEGWKQIIDRMPREYVDMDFQRRFREAMIRDVTELAADLMSHRVGSIHMEKTCTALKKIVRGDLSATQTDLKAQYAGIRAARAQSAGLQESADPGAAKEGENDQKPPRP